MIDGLVQRCRIPEDLNTVTQIGEEVAPHEVGLTTRSVDAIWQAVTAFFATGMHPAFQICLRRNGQIFLHRALGYARGNAPQDPPSVPKATCTIDTPFTIFSASKAVTAMVIHLLDQRRLIHLDDPVAEYIPEFARHGKEWITIRHVLAHRAGIPNLPPEAMDLGHLEHPETIVELLCELKPVWPPGRVVAYHAITGGFVLGEVVQRVTGTGIRTFLTHTIREPLHFRWMNYGVEERDLSRVAHNAFTGPPPLPPFSTLLHKALGTDVRTATAMSNDPRFLRAIIPAGNIVTTAEELSRFYQLLLNGGELDGVRIFDRRTVRRATLEQTSWEIDLSFGLPLRYSLGFMLGADYVSLYGPDTRHAFGHLGFTNMIGWADPERQIAGAILNSGKPLLYPEIYYAWNVMRVIASECPKISGHSQPFGAQPPSRPQRQCTRQAAKRRKKPRAQTPQRS
ncbi:MAG: beta-lactamase family protein [Candidatus Binatia bacterium]|nr:beta-lactamase family protein [Candidatus Binatia bacterium]